MSRASRKLPEVLPSRRHVGRVRLFGRREISKMDMFPVHRDACLPSAFRLISPFKGIAFAPPSATVAGILSRSCFAKIVEAVIRSISVDMIDPLLRPLAGFIEPREAMKRI